MPYFEDLGSSFTTIRETAVNSTIPKITGKPPSGNATAYGPSGPSPSSGGGIPMVAIAAGAVGIGVIAFVLIRRRKKR